MKFTKKMDIQADGEERSGLRTYIGGNQVFILVLGEINVLCFIGGGDYIFIRECED